MRLEIDEKALSALKSRLEKRGASSLSVFRNHVEAIAIPTGEARAMLDADPLAQNLATQQSEVGKRLGRLYEAVRDGDTTRDKARTEIERQVDVLRRGDMRLRAAEVLRRLPRRDFAELERLFAARLEGEGDGIGKQLLGIETGGDHIGGESRFLAKLRRDDDTGVRRDALGDPDPLPLPTLDSCFGPGHMDQATTGSFSGLGYGDNWSFATPSRGRFSCMPFAMVIVAGGGVANDQALLVDRLGWNARFSRMTVTADFSISLLSLSALAIAFSGAGASANFKIDAQFDTGEAFTSFLPLGDAIAPVFWYSSLGASGTRRLVLSTEVNPAARSVMLSAGGVVHTAAFGISGSYAMGTLFGNLTSLCVSLR